MAQARMANIMALAQSIGGPQAAPQGSRPAEHDLRANGGASVQPTSGEKTALKPEPVPCTFRSVRWSLVFRRETHYPPAGPPAEGSDLLPLRPWSETWSAGATWERSSGSSASTLEVFVKCNYFRLYEKLAADEDYESLPALAKDYSDTLLRPRSDLGSFAVVDKAKRRIAALVEAFIARMARSGMYPPESPVELFP